MPNPMNSLSIHSSQNYERTLVVMAMVIRRWVDYLELQVRIYMTYNQALLMLHRQTERYLKSNQIKHSSLYSKVFFQSPRQSFLLPGRLHKLSIDAETNYSHHVENKSNSAYASRDRDVCLTFTPGRFQKAHKAKRSSYSIELNSERINHGDAILKELQQKIKLKPQEREEREAERRTRIALKKLKNEIIFENELLTKPVPSEYFPKIKLTKRKFRIPKNKQVSEYCPWINEEQDHEDFHHNN